MMTSRYSCNYSFAVFSLGILLACHGFVPLDSKLVHNRILATTTTPRTTIPPFTTGIILFLDSSDNTNTENPKEDDPSSTQARQSLQEKMKSWEATEEEIKAATLGGVVPKRSDAFDIGLYIAFPLMVVSGLAFALFPFIMGSLDVDGVGPPPTV